MAASIDKISVRQQLDEIKETFDSLSQAGKVSEESALLFKSLFALIDIILAVFMEKKTQKTRNNSSIPSSQSDPDESTHQSDGKKQKRRKPQHNHFDHRFETVTISTLEPDNGRNCQTELIDQSVHSTQRRTLIDLRLEKVVTHVDACEKICPNCKTANRPEFPKPYAGPLQYSAGIKAFTLNLLVV